MKRLAQTTIIILGIWATGLFAQQTGANTAQFLRLAPNARAAGMGNAFTGLANDVNAMYWNPGGLGFLNRYELGLSGQQLFGDLLHFSVMGTMNRRMLGSERATLGFGLIYLGLQEDLQSTELGTSLARPGIGAGEVNNFVVIIPFGYRLDPISKNLSVGVSYKYVQSNLAEVSAAGHGLDAGVLGRFEIGDKYDLSLGATLQNYTLIPMQFFEGDGNNIKEDLPEVLRLGAALGVPIGDRGRLTFAYDAVKPRDNTLRHNFGAEYAWRFGGGNTLLLRSGYRLNDDNLGDFAFSMGFGFDLFQVDYAYNDYSPGRLDQAHLVSLYLRASTLEPFRRLNPRMDEVLAFRESEDIVLRWEPARDYSSDRANMLYLVVLDTDSGKVIQSMKNKAGGILAGAQASGSLPAPAALRAELGVLHSAMTRGALRSVFRDTSSVTQVFHWSVIALNETDQLRNAGKGKIGRFENRKLPDYRPLTLELTPYDRLDTTLTQGTLHGVVETVGMEAAPFVVQVHDDTENALVGEIIVTPDAGRNGKRTHPFEMPWNVQEISDDYGKTPHRLRVVVDPQNTVREHNENNNANAYDIEVIPKGYVEARAPEEIEFRKYEKMELPTLAYVFFEPNSANFSGNSMKYDDELHPDSLLKFIAGILENKFPRLDMTIEGYYHPRTEDRNPKIALERARRVRRKLIQYGAHEDQISIADVTTYDAFSPLSLSKSERQLQEDLWKAQCLKLLLSLSKAERKLQENSWKDQCLKLLLSLSKAERELQENLWKDQRLKLLLSPSKAEKLLQTDLPEDQRSKLRDEIDKVAEENRRVEIHISPAGASRIIENESQRLAYEKELFKPREISLKDSVRISDTVIFQSFIRSGRELKNVTLEVRLNAKDPFAIFSTSSDQAPEFDAALDEWNCRRTSDRSGSYVAFNRDYNFNVILTDAGGQSYSFDGASFYLKQTVNVIERKIFSLAKFDNDTLLHEFYREYLNGVVQRMFIDTIFFNVKLTGFADKIGSREYNDSLSIERAFNVSRILHDSIQYSVQNDLELKNSPELSKKKRDALISRIQPQLTDYKTAKASDFGEGFDVQLDVGGEIYGDNERPQGRLLNRRVEIELFTRSRESNRDVLPIAQQFVFPADSLGAMMSNRILSVAFDDSAVWIGTDKTLVRWERETGGYKIVPVPSKQATEILSLEFDRGGRILWVGTRNGLYELKNDSLWKHYGPDSSRLREPIIKVLHLDQIDRLNVATNAGIYRSYKENLDLYRIGSAANGLESSYVNRLYSEKDGQLWACTSRGVYLEEGEAWEVFSPHDKSGRNGLAEDDIRGMAIDNDGNLWFATARGVRFRNRADTTWKEFDVASGLLSTNITDIYKDRAGRIWAGTDNGVAVHQNGAWRTYSVAEGLPHKYVERLKADRENRLYVCTRGGLVVLEPWSESSEPEKQP